MSSEKADALFAEKKYLDSIEEYKKAFEVIEAKDDPAAYQRLGKCYIADEQFESGWQTLKKANIGGREVLNPAQKQELLCDIAFCCEKLSKYATAKVNYELALQQGVTEEIQIKIDAMDKLLGKEDYAPPPEPIVAKSGTYRDHWGNIGANSIANYKVEEVDTLFSGAARKESQTVQGLPGKGDNARNTIESLTFMHDFIDESHRELLQEAITVKSLFSKMKSKFRVQG